MILKTRVNKEQKSDEIKTKHTQKKKKKQKEKQSKKQ